MLSKENKITSYEAKGAPEYQSSEALVAAIQRHPPTVWPLLEPWSWTLLGEVTEEEADEAEIAAIAHDNTYVNGYNMTPGGKGRAVPHTEQTRQAISQALRCWPDQTLPTGLVKTVNGYAVIFYRCQNGQKAVSDIARGSSLS